MFKGLINSGKKYKDSGTVFGIEFRCQDKKFSWKTPCFCSDLIKSPEIRGYTYIDFLFRHQNSIPKKVPESLYLSQIYKPLKHQTL